MRPDREALLMRVTDVLRRSRASDVDELILALERRLPRELADEIPEVEREVRAGRMISAIRLYRERTRRELREAKEAADGMARWIGRQIPKRGWLAVVVKLVRESEVADAEELVRLLVVNVPPGRSRARS